MKKVLLALLLLPFISQAQIITSIAGIGYPASSGDGGPATAAGLSKPQNNCFDAAGNQYFGQTYANGSISTGACIRMIDPYGTITTVAGNALFEGFSGDGGLAVNAQLISPIADVDAAGNIYIADYSNYRVRKVDVATGIIHTIAGNGTNSSTGNGGPASAATIIPSDVCIDGMGNLFIADIGSIRRIDAVSGMIKLVAIAPSVKGMFFDPAGKLYVGSNGRVLKIDTASGIMDTVAGTGTGLYNGTNIPATTANMSVWDIARDQLGNLYIADAGNERVCVVDAAGILHRVAGDGTATYRGDGGPATASAVDDPLGLAVDHCGNLFICDYTNSRIRRVMYDTSGPTVIIDTIIASSDTVCAGQPATFTSYITGSSSLNYTWYVNGIVVSTAGHTYTYNPANGDSVRCQLNGIGVCTGLDTVVSSNTINMVSIPLTIPAVSLSGISSVPIGSMVTVTATVTGTGGSYNIKWFNNGSQFNTTTIPTITYIKNAGTDHVTARVIPTSVVCFDSTTSAIFTVAAIDTSTGVNYVAAPKAYLYPNPANKTLNIVSTENIETITVCNLLGQAVYSREYHASQVQVDVSALPAGVYIIKVNGPDSYREVRKFLKE